MGQRTASAAGRKVSLASIGVLLVAFADDLLGLVDDHDLGSRLGDPDHLADGARLIGEEVDAADVEDAVEDLRAKRQAPASAWKRCALRSHFCRFLRHLRSMPQERSRP